MPGMVTMSGRMTNNWDKCRKRIAPKVERGLRAAADILLAESQLLVPVETGDLKATGTVRKKQGGLRAVFVVGYGNRLMGDGRRPPWMYAAHRHEGRPHASMAHQLMTKFLEIPCKTKQPEMIQAMNRHALAGSSKE